MAGPILLKTDVVKLAATYCPTEAGSGASSTFNLLTGPALEETQEMPMTENVARLFNACDDVHDGKITMEQFQTVLTDSLMGLKPNKPANSVTCRTKWPTSQKWPKRPKWSGASNTFPTCKS